jgi:hypothetical protein
MNHESLHFMEEYNPNAIWTSKKKKVEYTPPEPASMPGNSGEEHTVSAPVRSTGGSGKKTAIIIVVAVALLAAAWGVWSFMSEPAPAPAVGLTFAAPSQVSAGDPFVFSVLYINSSTVALRNASLAITLPEGVSFVGQPESQQTETISLGDIAAGDSSSTGINLLATAAAGNVMQVSSTISYATDASGGKLFETSNTAGFAISAPIVGLAISAPANVFAGEDFVTEVSYRNTATHPINGVKITMQYPQGFTFTEASPTPAFPGNTAWNIGSLAAGAGGTITITGTMTGQNTALYSLSGTAAENVSGTLYAVAASAANVAITVSPLTVGAAVNNDPNYVAKLDDDLDYKITYANLSSTTFQNVAITATLSGAMFDLASVQSAASFNSRTETLTWYPANTPALASVAAGTNGSVDLRVKTKTSFPISVAADKDFTLGIHLNASSPTVPAGTEASSTSVSADIANKVGGVIAVDAVGYRYETGTTIVNTGPYPPVVNQPTMYTIHWRVTNYSTDASGVTVSAYLQSGTTCTGKITSTISAVPVCNAGTGEVTWSIPSVSAGTGVLGAPIEAVFQVENMPAVNQVGQIVTLLGETSLAATDDFTGAILSSTANPVDTNIPQDRSATANDRTVQK